MENIEDYVSMTVMCQNCGRVYTAPIKDGIENSINKLSEAGCIYCGKDAENKQLSILSFEKPAFEASLTELYANLCKYVTFD